MLIYWHLFWHTGCLVVENEYLTKIKINAIKYMLDVTTKLFKYYIQF